MRKRTVASIAFTGAAVMAGTGLNAHAAHAASIGKWTVTNGGEFTATASLTHLTALSKGTVVDKLTCHVATAAGSLSKATFSQSGNTPFQAGTTTGTFGNASHECSSSKGAGLKFTATLKAGKLFASTNSGGVTHGTIKSISASIKGTGIVGCSATFKGSQPYSYNNTTGTLTVLGATSNAKDLKTTAVTGCAGLLKVSQSNFFSGAYSVASPFPVITRTPAN